MSRRRPVVAGFTRSDLGRSTGIEGPESPRNPTVTHAVIGFGRGVQDDPIGTVAKENPQPIDQIAILLATGQDRYNLREREPHVLERRENSPIEYCIVFLPSNSPYTLTQGESHVLNEKNFWLSLQEC